VGAKINSSWLLTDELNRTNTFLIHNKSSVLLELVTEHMLYPFYILLKSQ